MTAPWRSPRLSTTKFQPPLTASTSPSSPGRLLRIGLRVCRLRGRGVSALLFRGHLIFGSFGIGLRFGGFLLLGLKSFFGALQCVAQTADGAFSLKSKKCSDEHQHDGNAK